MFKAKIKSVVAIDPERTAVRFFVLDTAAENGYRQDRIGFFAKPTEDNYFTELQALLTKYREENPQFPTEEVTLLFPDEWFISDYIAIPTAGKKAMKNDLAVATGALYKNVKQLIFHNFVLTQDKNSTVYSLIGIRTELLTRFYGAFSGAGYAVKNATFRANAAVNGAISVNPKLGAASYLLMDIGRRSTRLIFVIKGKTKGWYSLPFGYAVLSKTAPVDEKSLFDHAAAELLVLNAKETARAKQLTQAIEPTAQEETDEEDGAETNELALAQAADERENIAYENFRIFMKWALELITRNGDITVHGTPEAIYVNMPSEYGYLLEKANLEIEENKHRFVGLGAKADGVAERALALYGGLFAAQHNKVNNF